MVMQIPGRGITSGGLITTAPLELPSGRLTLTTLTPVLTATVSASATVLYTPYQGSFVPLQIAAGSWAIYPFSELTNTLSDATKNPAAAVANANYDLFVWNDAGTMRLGRGPYWQTAAATVTFTIANPSVVGWVGHGLNIGDPVSFTTTGALPHGGTNDIVVGTTYFIIAAGFGANSFEISLTVGGAAINTVGGAQSGVHTGIGASETSRSTGAGTSQLTLQNGVNVNTVAITNGPAAGLGTYVGTIRTNATATADFKFGTSAAGGGNAILNVWNAYNRVDIATLVRDSTASWTYAVATMRAANGNVNNSAQLIKGLNEDMVRAAYMQRVSISTGAGAFYQVAIGLDSTTAQATNSVESVMVVALATETGQGLFTAQFHDYVGLGFHTITGLEKSDGSTTGTTTAAGTDQGLALSTRM